MTNRSAIPAEDLIKLARQLRVPSPPPSGATPTLRRFLRSVDYGRELAARRTLELLKAYGVEIEQEVRV